MLLDEPFSALDTGLRASTRKAVAQMLADAGVTTLLVTHDQEEALSIADQVAVMRDGQFTQVGTPQQVYLQPERPLHRRVPRRVRVAAVHGRVGDRGLCAWPRTRADTRGRRGRHADAAARTACRDSGFGQRTTHRCGNGDRHRVPGSDVLLTIDPAGDAAPIIVRQHSLNPPPVDAKVRIDVVGDGVVFR